MAYPRKPSAVHEMSGAWDKNPARRRARAHEPVPDGPLVEPPPYLSPRVAYFWRYLVSIASNHVLGTSDAEAVAVAARFMAEVNNPKTYTDAANNHLRIALGELGMTPASRSKVMQLPFVPPPGEAGLAPDGRPLTGNEFADV
jgi:phage terminase small subunit